MNVLHFPHLKADRRKVENRLQRATTEAEQLEERQIEYWLGLADTALDDSWETESRRKRSA